MSHLPALEARPFTVTLTNANTEYSQVLPDNTKKIEFQARGSADVRWALVTGKVAGPTAHYSTLKADGDYAQDFLDLVNKTLYFASSTAGTVVEGIAWS